jgi:hypothetical protein
MGKGAKELILKRAIKIYLIFYVPTNFRIYYTAQNAMCKSHNLLLFPVVFTIYFSISRQQHEPKCTFFCHNFFQYLASLSDVPDIVCQDYAVPHMENLLPKMPGGYIGVRLTPPLNNIFPKPPKVPPPPLNQEKYYAATQICSSKPPGTMTLNGHILSSSNTMNNNSNGSNTTASLDGRNGCITPTTPLNHHLNSYSDFDTLLMDDEVQLKEFPRDKLVIVEKLGCGMFGELHLCETKGLT